MQRCIQPVLERSNTTIENEASTVVVVEEEEAVELVGDVVGVYYLVEKSLLSARSRTDRHTVGVAALLQTTQLLAALVSVC